MLLCRSIYLVTCFLLDPYIRPIINQIINNNLSNTFFFCMNERYGVLSPLIVGRKLSVYTLWCTFHYARSRYQLLIRVILIDRSSFNRRITIRKYQNQKINFYYRLYTIEIYIYIMYIVSCNTILYLKKIIQIILKLYLTQIYNTYSNICLLYNCQACVQNYLCCIFLHSNSIFFNLITM